MKIAMVAAGVIALAGIAQSAVAAEGKEVFEKSCAGCHKAMDPKVGDKKAWEPLIKKGTDTLVASVIKGKGAMPPKGGAASLSNADIKAAVEYMESQSK
ncbi:MAG: c-type cytochrome [Burkholderiales bacterium]